MDIKEFRELKVGDVIYIPHREPFPSRLRVVQGVENKDIVGQDNPYVITMSHRHVFPWQIELAASYKIDGREMDPPWDKLVTLGDPLFVNEDDNGIS